MMVQQLIRLQQVPPTLLLLRPPLLLVLVLLLVVPHLCTGHELHWAVRLHAPLVPALAISPLRHIH
jgi:hypothetical protein